MSESTHTFQRILQDAFAAALASARAIREAEGPPAAATPPEGEQPSTSSTSDTSTGAVVPANLDVGQLVGQIAKKYGGPGQIPDPSVDALASKRWPMWKPVKEPPKGSKDSKGGAKGSQFGKKAPKQFSTAKP